MVISVLKEDKVKIRDGEHCVLMNSACNSKKDSQEGLTNKVVFEQMLKEVNELCRYLGHDHSSQSNNSAIALRQE